MSKKTQAVGFTFIASKSTLAGIALINTHMSIVGSIALVAGIIYLIRRVLRQHRLGKAYSPPSSPLLNAISDPSKEACPSAQQWEQEKVSSGV
jgi:hypothetical protein